MGRTTVVFHSVDHYGVRPAPYNTVLIEQQIPSHLTLETYQLTFIGNFYSRTFFYIL